MQRKKNEFSSAYVIVTREEYAKLETLNLHAMWGDYYVMYGDDGEILEVWGGGIGETYRLIYDSDCNNPAGACLSSNFANALKATNRAHKYSAWVYVEDSWIYLEAEGEDYRISYQLANVIEGVSGILEINPSKPSKDKKSLSQLLDISPTKLAIENRKIKFNDVSWNLIPNGVEIRQVHKPSQDRIYFGGREIEEFVKIGRKYTSDDARDYLKFLYFESDENNVLWLFVTDGYAFMKKRIGRFDKQYKFSVRITALEALYLAIKDSQGKNTPYAEIALHLHENDTPMLEWKNVRVSFSDKQNGETYYVPSILNPIIADIGEFTPLQSTPASKYKKEDWLAWDGAEFVTNANPLKLRYGYMRRYFPDEPLLSISYDSKGEMLYVKGDDFLAGIMPRYL